jgi:hypothetical protein
MSKENLSSSFYIPINRIGMIESRREYTRRGIPSFDPKT